MKELVLHSNSVDGSGLIALLRAEGFEALHRLDLHENAFVEVPSEGEGAAPAPLVFDEDFRGPREPFALDLVSCGLHRDTVIALAQTYCLEEVTSLWLGGNAICVEGAAALGSTVRVAQLTALDVEDCGLGDEGLAALFVPGSPGVLSGLESLFLQGNGLTDASARVLPGVGFMRLRELSLLGNLFGVGWVEAIASCAGFASLDALWLSGNPLGDAGLELLAGATHLRLKTLGLEEVGASARGLIALVTGCVMEGLETLHVDCEAWTDEVTHALASSRSSQHLESLDVGEWSWGEEALTALATSTNLRALGWVDVDRDDELTELLGALHEAGATLNPWTDAALSARDLELSNG